MGFYAYTLLWEV